MNWFTWLSRTSLDPPHVYEYALTFAQNELEEDDAAYFSHEFLRSMGISKAKHRLEILNLARKERGRRLHPMLWVVSAVKQTRTFLAKHIRTLFHRKDSGFYVVPTRNHSLRWKVSMLQRNKNLRGVKKEWPTLRYESPMFDSDQELLMMLTDETTGPDSGSGQSPNSAVVKDNDESARNGDGNPWDTSFSRTLVDDGEFWFSMDKIKWDSMFHNLKPT